MDNPLPSDFGVSRLLRYSYGGFLLAVIASLADQKHTKWVVDTLGWELAALTTLVLGAGVYAFHRHLVVPVHHRVLSLFWWFGNSCTGISNKTSLSPTAWLA